MAKFTKYKQLLLTNSLSQRAVSKNVGICQASVSLFANGYQNVTIATLKKFCIYHNCSPNDLLDWEKWQEEKKKKEAKKQNPDATTEQS